MKFSFTLSIISLCLASVTRGWAAGSGGPYVNPKYFKDDNKQFLEFTCSTQLKTNELLSWYQKKGSETILLKITQREQPGSAWTVIKLNKTLERSDNCTEVFCTRQTVLPDRTFSKGQESQRISIVFHRDIKPVETAFVTIEPKDNYIYFDVNRTLQLSCSGSSPLDGRQYLWFLKDSESRLTVPDRTQQRYNESTNLNRLVLTLDESHHRNQLFCAQEWHLNIQHVDGSCHMKKYGELVRSETVTLMLKGKEYDPTQILALVVPLTLVAIVAVVVAVWARRRRGREPSHADKDEDIYASTYASGQVTYAVLDLPAGARAAPAGPATGYASIIGVLVPSNN